MNRSSQMTMVRTKIYNNFWRAYLYLPILELVILLKQDEQETERVILVFTFHQTTYYSAHTRTGSTRLFTFPSILFKSYRSHIWNSKFFFVEMAMKAVIPRKSKHKVISELMTKRQQPRTVQTYELNRHYRNS